MTLALSYHMISIILSLLEGSGQLLILNLLVLSLAQETVRLMLSTLNPRVGSKFKITSPTAPKLKGLRLP